MGLTRPYPELDRALAEAVAGGGDHWEQARRIYEYVNNLITEPSGPSRAVEVLLTRSGSRTVLFKALLERAGIPCRWAFLRPQDSLLPIDEGTHPVLFLADDDAYRSKLLESLHGLLYATGGSLFSGKVGQALFD